MTQKTITIQQTGSPIRRPEWQRTYLKALGLGKINRIRTLKDTPEVRGLLMPIRHLVKIVEG